MGDFNGDGHADIALSGDWLAIDPGCVLQRRRHVQRSPTTAPATSRLGATNVKVLVGDFNGEAARTSR